MFCTPGLFLGCIEGAEYRFPILRSRTCFGRFRGRRGSFSCFTLPNSFWAVPTAQRSVFMFCAPVLIFGGTKGVGSRFNVLHARTGFRRYQGRPIPFLCFVLPDSFSTVPRASGPVFMFCAPGLISGGTEAVGSHFHVLPARNRFHRYRGRWFPISCFACPDTFLAVPRVPSTVFMFCAVALVSSGSEAVGARFHVLPSWNLFGRYRRRRVPFSSFAHPDTFSAVPSASGPFSCFALPDSFGMVPRAPGPVFMFCAPRLVTGGIESIGYRFHILSSWTRFRRYRGRQVPFSSFVLPHSFSTVPRASGPIFMFWAPGLVLGCTGSVESRFHVLRSRNRLGTYQGRRVPFSIFALLDTFLAVPRASGPVLMFCAPRLVFDSTEAVGARFHVLRSRTFFWHYRGRWVPFSCFALSDSFRAVPRASEIIFMFCAP
jgi:hypothetical protein